MLRASHTLRGLHRLRLQLTLLRLRSRILWGELMRLRPRMVGYNPPQLVAIPIRVAISTVCGEFADGRLVVGALHGTVQAVVVMLASCVLARLVADAWGVWLIVAAGIVGGVLCANDARRVFPAVAEPF